MSERKARVLGRVSGALHGETARKVLSVLPDRADDIARLGVLLTHGEPIVTVIGKYNHGKSRLLNELIGSDTFAVADRRETVRLAHHVHGDVRWLDAPGLDADVGTEDDRHALHAAWLKSDIRLFVHAAKEGELDAKELALLAELREDGARTRRQTLFVLAQIDQLPDDAALRIVSDAIGAQAPGVVLHAVSAARHRKGLDEGKKLFVEKSGMPALRVELDAAIARVPASRADETALLFREIGAELHALRACQETLLAALHDTRKRQRRDFEHGLRTVIDRAAADIDAMLNALGTDHAMVPDTAKDAYAPTAGKIERAHIQMAYSRVCIEIDGFLAGHGVTGIPFEQETVARALNSVMVAVMGVSVKFRKDLRAMFGTGAGKARMQRDFLHYYELSADRQTLATCIAESESAIAALHEASDSLRALERSA